MAESDDMTAQQPEITIAYQEGPPFSGAEPMTRWLAAFNEATLRAPRRFGFAAALGGKGRELVGGIQYRWYGEDGYVDYLAVHESWRGQQIGAQLIRAMESALAQQGCRRVFIDTEAFQAPGFYERMGYRKVGHTPEHMGGYDRLTFRKDLSLTCASLTCASLTCAPKDERR